MFTLGHDFVGSCCLHGTLLMPRPLTVLEDLQRAGGVTGNLPCTHTHIHTYICVYIYTYLHDHMCVYTCGVMERDARYDMLWHDMVLSDTV